MRYLVLILCLAMGTAAAAQDRDQTLADIRQELTVLNVEIQKLRRELSTTGSAGGLDTAGSALQRLDAIEAEAQRLTSKTEELEHVINRVVEDGTNRIGDLEFRLVELEGGDVSKLGETSTLGGVTPGPTGGSTGATADSGTNAGTGTAGDTGTGAADPSIAAVPGGTELAVSEEADFRRAGEALANGDFRGAADLFAAFGETYPGSPLEAQARLGHGKALEQLGEQSQAARAYLGAFTLAPNGPEAPEALFRLGRMLGNLGQTQESCMTLREVTTRFPDAAVATDARAEMQSRSCS